MNRFPKTYVAVVDDDESLCRSLARLLRVSGMHGVAYRSAESFLADTKQPKFDCLVLDIQLAGMSGVELHRQLKASGSTTPVVYITAHDAPAAREEAEAVGFAGYFRKTDSGELVIQAIRQAANLPAETDFPESP
jgi:FixJ family two-component response regulator